MYKAVLYFYPTAEMPSYVSEMNDYADRILGTDWRRQARSDTAASA